LKKKNNIDNIHIMLSMHGQVKLVILIRHHNHSLKGCLFCHHPTYAHTRYCNKFIL